jgi:peptidoglycan/xylan/chitin deacetylase (PgdA/CDA1 family)
MKNFAKAAMCALYIFSGAMRLQEALARRAGRSFLATLLFHRVTDDIPEDGLTVSTRRFRKICRLLRRRFRVVPLAEIARMVRVGGPLPSRTVAITFDDCYGDNFRAARVLADEGLPASFFVPTAFVGTDNVFDWDRRLPRRLPNLTWAQVQLISRMGFEIGSHSVTHPNLARFSAERTWRELYDSRTTLEDRLGRAVHWFAYPFGGRSNFPAERLPLVKEAGNEGCLSGYGGFIFPGADLCMLPREAVPYFRCTLHLELHLSGCLSWYYGAKRLLGWKDPKPFPCSEVQEILPARNREVLVP